MPKRRFVNLRIEINNDFTPEPPSRRRKCMSPDEGCYSAPREGLYRTTSSTRFDQDIDCLLSLQDDGYLSFENQDTAQGHKELELGPPLFESSPCNSSWESTLPLEVQVKSVVVPVGPVPPAEGARKPRFNVEEEKRKYLNAVSRHMNERPTTQDVMGELLCLMSTVARDTQGSQWQHPSDLTRRNYQKRFAPTPMTLEEYEAKQDLKHKRFEKIPKYYRRPE